MATYLDIFRCISTYFIMYSKTYEHISACDDIRVGNNPPFASHPFLHGFQCPSVGYMVKYRWESILYGKTDGKQSPLCFPPVFYMDFNVLVRVCPQTPKLVFAKRGRAKLAPGAPITEPTINCKPPPRPLDAKRHTRLSFVSFWLCCSLSLFLDCLVYFMGALLVSVVASSVS